MELDERAVDLVTLYCTSVTQTAVLLRRSLYYRDRHTMIAYAVLSRILDFWYQRAVIRLGLLGELPSALMKSCCPAGLLFPARVTLECVLAEYPKRVSAGIYILALALLASFDDRNNTLVVTSYLGIRHKDRLRILPQV